MDPVSWLEHIAKASPVLLLVVVVLLMFVDGLALIGALLPGDLLPRVDLLAQDVEAGRGVVQREPRVVRRDVDLEGIGHAADLE